jgi:hypothetical protein
LYPGTGETVPHEHCTVSDISPSLPLLPAPGSGTDAWDTGIPGCIAIGEVGPRGPCLDDETELSPFVGLPWRSGKISRETCILVLGAVDDRRLVACPVPEGVVAVRINALSSPIADDLRRAFVLLTDDDGLDVAIVGSFRTDWEAVGSSGALPEASQRVFARAMGASSSFALESLL